ncbi:MAG: NAD(P)/FAD-dependent oxidoreductase [Oscillospiraceae bacterium]|nr:NAD(P)/FAD-dependent oxidoreductase [Oscillospiraceae bacterium]
MKTDIVVIGAGAAGLMAAISAAELGADVLIVEKNDRAGVKLRITGKGRCNVANNCSEAEVMKNIPRNEKFMFSALRGFSPADAMEFFERIGVPLKTERGNRVFPVSDKAADVAEALDNYAASLGVKRIKGRAMGIKLNNGEICAAKTSVGEINCRRVIVATGGLSYPKTGSTGEGYTIAKSVGHSIVEPEASLVPLISPDEFCPAMQGLSLRNVRLTLNGSKSGKLFEDFGEMQFTHFGVTGPLILSASAHMGRKGAEEYTISLDLKPALDEKALDARILRDFSEQANKDFANALGGLAPRLLIPVLIERSGIDPHSKVNSVTREQRQALLRLFKEFTVRISGKRPVDEAVITSGGVATGEIKPSTMESRLLSGLYFAGEVIDVDAYTGGFNLQIAWSTAYAAGKSAAESLW